MRRVFDLGADPEGIADHLGQDRLLAPAVQRFPGLRVPGAWEGFEVAVRAILGQQVSVKAASTLAGRLVRAFGNPLQEPDPGGLNYLFPAPAALASANFAGFGLPTQRSEAIRALSIAVREGEVDLTAQAGLEALVERLASLPGIGPWTAHYIALRLGEPDAFPAGDLGLLRAAGQNGGSLAKSELLNQADNWRPWRSYAAIYLWKTYAEDQGGSFSR
jgi:DNA-3-methyladenine glycosylase II